MLACLALVAGCNAPPGPTRCVDRRVVMGCDAAIVVYAEDRERAMSATREAFERMAVIEDALSDYRPGSEAMQVVREVGVWRDVGPDLRHALVESDRWRRWSRGAFDPAIGATTRLWRESRRADEPPSRAMRSAAAEASGWSFVEFDPLGARVRVVREGLHFDFGGIGKGIAADAALRRLRSAGFDRVLVDVGGDILIGAPPPGRPGWSIGVEDPAGRTVETLVLSHAAVATSGDRHQHLTTTDGRRLSHIVDGRTLDPIPGPARVTVIVRATDGAATAADALASIASILDPEALRANAGPGLEATILIQDGDEPPVEIVLESASGR